MSSAKFALLSNSAVCMLNSLTPQSSYFILNITAIQFPSISKKFCILIHKLNTVVFSEMLQLKEYFLTESNMVFCSKQSFNISCEITW